MPDRSTLYAKDLTASSQADGSSSERLSPERLSSERLSPERFRAAFRHYPSGVAVVTADGPDGPIGVTVTSLRSLSASPALVAFSIARTASTWPGFVAAERLLVHLLGVGQEELATRFATSGIDRFAAPTDWAPQHDGLPRLAGAQVVLQCHKTHQLTFGESDLIVAEVLETEHAPTDGPLLYSDGGYHQLHRRPST